MNRAVIKAIREGDAPAARQAMKTHLENAFNNYLIEIRRRIDTD